MCSDTTALLCRPSTLSMIFVHNHMFYRSGAFPQCIAASPPDSFVCLQTSEACSTSHWNTPTSDNLFHSQPSSTSPPFSQPDDILLLSRELPPLALAWSFSRARFESWYSDCRSFSVTATRPRPPDEMGCQNGGHLGFGGCARNFCGGCRHCFFLLRAGVGASLLLAFKTFHASVLRP